MRHTTHIECFSCKGLVPDVDGPTHAYIRSAPGCWKLYGEILAKEYMPERYDPAVHRMTVDTYAVQHPGNPERRAIQSVNGHLMCLYVTLEKELPFKEANALLKRAAEDDEFQKRFQWLEPPSFRGTLTVADVLQASDARQHAHLVRRWAESVWNVWKHRHSATIAGLVDLALVR